MKKYFKNLWNGTFNINSVKTPNSQTATFLDTISTTKWFLYFQMNTMKSKYLRAHSLSTYEIFSEKLPFLTTWSAHQVVGNISISENFTYVLNEWPCTKITFLLNPSSRCGYNRSCFIFLSAKDMVEGQNGNLIIPQITKYFQ